jgi:transcriptional regulator with XRE-family HTH domain
MSKENAPVRTFLEAVMEMKGRLPSQLAADLGVSHATVIRWLSGMDIPSTKSCQTLADYSRIPLERVLSIAGHLPPIRDNVPSEWPEFREYAKRKYRHELDDDLIAMIEDLIERRRQRNRLRRQS